MAGKVASPTRSADEGLELPAATPAFSHWSATQWTVLKSGDAALAAVGVAVKRRMAARVPVARPAILLLFAFTLCFLPCAPRLARGTHWIRERTRAMPSLAHGRVADAMRSLRRAAWHRYLRQGPAESSAGRQYMRQAHAGAPPPPPRT